MPYCGKKVQCLLSLEHCIVYLKEEKLPSVSGVWHCNRRCLVDIAEWWKGYKEYGGKGTKDFLVHEDAWREVKIIYNVDVHVWARLTKVFCNEQRTSQYDR